VRTFLRAHWPALVVANGSLRGRDLSRWGTAGIDLRVPADAVEFVLHWVFIAAQPIV